MSLEDEDPVARLTDAFRSLLDDTLVVAIASDYDLSTESGYKAAEETLRGISQDVALEEATGFNPTGTAGAAIESDAGPRDDASASSASASLKASSHAKRSNSSSTGLSSVPPDHSSPIPELTTFDNDSDETKYLNLRSIFSDMKEYDVRHALKKASGDFQAALDELLSMQFLQSTGQQPRGIDGFFQDEADNTVSGRKKNKKKRKNAQNKQLLENSSLFDLESANTEVLQKNQAKQLRQQDEIAFLSDQMNLPFDHVSEIYYRKKCSSGATAVEILDQYISLGITSEDDDGKSRAKKLGSNHPNIPDKYLLTLVQVTESNSESPNEMAALLSKHFAKNPWTQTLNLSHRITPLPDEDLEGSSGSIPSTPSGKFRVPVSPAKATAAQPKDLEDAIQRISNVQQSRRDALAHASELTRRGASNPLYRQAAVVYRERVNEQTRHAQHLNSFRAEHHVALTSTTTKIDLHGVTVRDGTRIARNKTQEWWDNLGEYRSRKAKEQPFTVVTGIGRHSAGGVSQLRQAVAAALLQDGWKMQVETGRFFISGRR